MKKNYISPDMLLCIIEPAMIIATSAKDALDSTTTDPDQLVKPDDTTPYGGRRNNIWDDEEELDEE